MRKGSGSKQKGAAFERLVCVHLSLWLTNGQSKDCFWRSAMSGGRATLGARKGDKLRRQAGDITATSPEGHRLTDAFFVEAKFYKSLDVSAFFLGRGGKLQGFWDTTAREARTHGKWPMLIAKQNNLPALVLTYPDALLADPKQREGEPLWARNSLAYPLAMRENVGVYWFADVFPLPVKRSLERYSRRKQ